MPCNAQFLPDTHTRARNSAHETLARVLNTVGTGQGAARRMCVQLAETGALRDSQFPLTDLSPAGRSHLLRVDHLLRFVYGSASTP